MLNSVIISSRGAISIVSLNRVKALNALDVGMIRGLAPVSSQSSPVAVVLRGEGGKAFCAGGDVRTRWDNRGNLAAQVEFFREEYKVDFALARHGNSVCPHVALWDGVVMGGGVGISIHAPFRIATGKTMFAMPETAIGIFPDVGGSLVLPRLQLGPWWGLYLGLTGSRLLGADVVHGGLATHFIPEGRLDSLVDTLASLDPTVSPFAARKALVSSVVASYATPPASLPPFTYSPEALASLARAFDPAGGSVGRVMARLREEAEVGGGGGEAALKALSALEKMSPTSLLVSFEAQVKGASPTATLGGTLAMELRVITNLVRGGEGDFYEGVRAVLVDKGKGPPPSWGKAIGKEGLKQLFEGGGEVEGEGALRALGAHLPSLQ